MRNFIIVIIVLFTSTLSVLSQSINHWETVVFADDFWRYRANDSTSPTGWFLPEFDDSFWPPGQGGFGYGDNDDTSIVQPCISVSIRTEFTITNSNDLIMAVLHVDYDDAFIAWLNGVEIARSAGLNSIDVLWNTPSSESREAQMYLGGLPNSYVIEEERLRNIIRNGTNVLAIEVHNTSSISSDLSIIPYLSFAVGSSQSYFRSTPDWFVPPVINLTSNLPIIIIDTKGQTILKDSEIIASMRVVDCSDAPNAATDTVFPYNGFIHIEYHGQSSYWNDWPKKSYNVELINSNEENIDSALLGMPPGNDWVLYGPYNDKSLIRNALAYNLGRKMARYAPRTAFCELIINDRYAGIYLLIEKIRRDKHRVNIAKLESNETTGDDLTGGYIVKIDKGEFYEFGWTSPYSPPGKSVNFLWHYPKPQSIVPAQKNYIKNYITSFENTLNSSFWNDPFIGYYRYIDIASAVDYFIINEFTKNIDAYRISAYLYKDKDSKGGRLTFGPMWDYDLSFGNANYYGGDTPQGWVFKSISPDDYFPVPFWWEKFTNDCKFNDMVRCRWEELKKDGWFSQSGIYASIDSMTGYINDARIRNSNSFNALGIWVWPNAFVGSTYEQEVNYLKQFVANRILWLDNYLPGVCREQKPELFLSAIPNPFTNYFDIRIILPSPGSIRIALTSITGQMVWIMERYSDLSAFAYRIDASNLNKGVYVLSVYLNGGYLGALKLIKQ